MMKEKRYIIKLKNMSIIDISKEQYDKLVLLLTSKPPAFININGNIIKTDYIATITHSQGW